MPIVMAPMNTPVTVIKILAEDKVKKHLENLGILKGSEVELIQNNNGVIILKVKEGRVALNYDLASKIFVEWGI